jgi:hypothetical protein
LTFFGKYLKSQCANSCAYSSWVKKLSPVSLEILPLLRMNITSIRRFPHRGPYYGIFPVVSFRFLRAVASSCPSAPFLPSFKVRAMGRGSAQTSWPNLKILLFASRSEPHEISWRFVSFTLALHYGTITLVMYNTEDSSKRKLFPPYTIFLPVTLNHSVCVHMDSEDIRQINGMYISCRLSPRPFHNS